MNNVPRPSMMNPMLAEAEKTVAVFAQLLAKALGAYRVVECPTCLTNANTRMRFLEITIPDAGNIYVALGNYDFLSHGNVIELDAPPESIKMPQLIGWLQGISLQS